MIFPLLRRSRSRTTPPAQTPASPAVPPTLAGPAIVRGSLTVFPLRRRLSADAPAAAAAYASLTAALESGRARLHETDGLRETEVENMTDTDLFAQAGETVRGGWQDWTMGVDLVVPRRSQRRRMSLREFCLQPGRWHFADRREVSCAFGPGDEAAGVLSPADEALRRLPVSGANVVGVAYAVHGVLRGAHFYAGAGLFTEVWPGLLERIGAEAGAAATMTAGSVPPTVEETEAWLARAVEKLAAGKIDAMHSVTPRVSLVARELPGDGSGNARLICLETLDAGRDGLCVHRAILAADGAAAR